MHSTVTLNGSASIAGPATVNFDTGGILAWAGSGSTLGDFGNTGKVVIEAGGLMQITGSGTRTLANGYTLRVENNESGGGIQWGGTADISMCDASLIEVVGTFVTTVDRSLNVCSGTPQLHVLTGGEFKKTGGVGTTAINVPLDTDGKTTATSGTLNLAGTVVGDGEVAATGGGITSLNSSVDPGTDLNVTGTGVRLGDSGTIGGAGTLTVDGTLGWAGSGTLGDFGNAGQTRIAPGGTLAISGANSRTVANGYTLQIDGDATWTGTADISLCDTSQLNVGGNLDAQTSRSIFICSGTPQVHIESGGTLEKTVSSATTTVSAPIDNDGTVRADIGTISLTSGSGGTSDGDYSAAAGAVTEFAGGDHLLGPNPGMGGLGTVRVSSGTVSPDPANPDSKSTISVGDALTLAGGGVAGAGTLDVEGTLNFTTGSTLGDFSNAGTTRIAPGGTMGITGAVGNVFLANAYTLRIDGTATWGPGTPDILLCDTSRIEVGSGGLLDAQSNESIDFCSGSAQVDVLNGGELRKSAGIGTTAINVPLDSDGKTAATSGTLSLAGGATGSGQLDATGSGITAIDSPLTPEAGMTVTGTGVRLNNGSIGGAQTLTVNGTLNWPAGGTLGDFSNLGTTRIAPGGTLAISGSGSRLVANAYTLQIDGNATWAGGTNLDLCDGSQLRIGSGGTLDAQSNQSINVCSGTPQPTLVQAGGTLRKSVGTGSTTVNVPITNSGTIQATIGEIDLQSSLSNYNTGLQRLTGGSYVATSTGRIEIDGLNMLSNAASITLGNSGSMVNDLNTNGLANLGSNLAAGKLELINGKNLTVPNFSNSGEIALGQSDTLTTNNFTQPAAGKLKTTVNGTTPGTNAGRLVATGTMNLNGTLHVISDGLPAPTDSVQIMSSTGARTGTFSTVRGAAGYSVAYGTNSVTLNSTTQPTVSIDDGAVVEGDLGTQTLSTTVRLSQASNLPVNIRYRTVDANAVAPGDYASVPFTNLTFAPGETAKPLNFTVNGDELHEGDESFTVSLATPLAPTQMNATFSDNAGRARILDDEGPLTVHIGDPKMNEGNAGQSNMQFPVTLDEAPGAGQTVTVNYSTSDGTATTANSDYVSTSGTLTFNSGTGASQLVNVPVNGDVVNEPNQTFKLTLDKPSLVGAELGDGLATATIRNDDGAAAAVKPYLYVSDEAVLEPDSPNTTTMSFDVTLSEPAPSAVTVNYKTLNSAATAPGDYTAIDPNPPTTVLHFDAGDTTPNEGPVQVTVQGDEVKELTETFKLVLTGPTNAILGDNTGLGYILDDEGPLTVSVEDRRIVEGDSGTKNVLMTLRASAVPAAGQTINVTATTEPDSGSATAGSDYQSVAPTIVGFNSTTGATRTLTVPVNGDATLEGNETFTVTLSTPNRALIADQTATGTIYNDD